MNRWSLLPISGGLSLVLAACGQSGSPSSGAPPVRGEPPAPPVSGAMTVAVNNPRGVIPIPAMPSSAAAAPKPAGPCARCATQEDFDAAQRKGSACCPGSACVGDSDCTGGRVCCRIPSGSVCTDSGRCGASDRIKSAAKVNHGACRTVKDCPDGELCCGTGAGPGKPGKCMGIQDGIKGCAPPE